jgi:hypothetical protein
VEPNSFLLSFLSDRREVAPKTLEIDAPGVEVDDMLKWLYLPDEECRVGMSQVYMGFNKDQPLPSNKMLKAASVYVSSVRLKHQKK